jgi:CRP/FNR family transcriptional activator FtrB
LQSLEPLPAHAGPPAKIRLDEFLELPLFQGVDRHLIERLAPSFSAYQYRFGTKLMDQGELVPRHVIISRGIVELTRVEGEHQFGVLLLSSRDMVMPSAAMFMEPTLVTVRALTTTRTLEIDATILRLALERSPRLSSNMMKAMSGQWRMAVRNILDLNCRTAAQRIGAFLLRLSDLHEEGVSPVLPIPKRHLAARLGITPETLSRTLQIVAAHGLHLRGRTILVRDRAAIEEFCGPDPYPAPDERPLNVFAF